MPTLVIGIDEAGYGPNLGPLVIAATAWWLDSTKAPADRANPDIPYAEILHDCLLPEFLARPFRSLRPHIPLGDSKVIHQGYDGFVSVEIGVRYWLRFCNQHQLKFDELVHEIALPSALRLKAIPWYDSDLISPESASSVTSAEKLREFWGCDSFIAECDQKIDSMGIQFLGLATDILDEPEYNLRTEVHDNKSTLLSITSIGLANELLERVLPKVIASLPKEDKAFDIQFYCDKHGGRNRYQSVLEEVLNNHSFTAIQEGTDRSDYLAMYRSSLIDKDGSQEIPMHWSFLAKGDRLVPIGLASMAAKWFREELMARLNRFWQSHVPRLAATAGYPVDAKRFATAIQSTADELKLDRNSWWRSR